MISLDKLMNLSEAATGFKGGSIVDELPGLSLTEATAGLPVVILESQIELNESVMAQNEALVESVIVGLQSGTQADVDSLTEGAFETLVNKIKAFFEKLRKWVNSIIAKLTVQIDKMRLSGTQMLAKYKDSKMLNHSFEDLTVNGYKFEKKDPFTAADTYVGAPADLIAKAVPELERPQSFSTGTDEKAMEAKLDKVKETSSADRKLEFAKAMTSGIDLSNGDSWQSELKKELYGDKVDLKHGEDFTLDSVKAMLKGEDLDKIKAAYGKLKNAIDKDEAEVRKAAEKFKKDNTSKTPGADAPKTVTIANNYFTAYLNIYQDCTAVIGAIQDIRVNYEKAKVSQAKTIFARMLTYKKKDNNDASGIDEIDLLDFEL